MSTIEIKNVGPIKEAKFNLNKINVFMGPQSSGKSTIAKIISYCTWVEKDVATSQSLKVYQDNKTYFREHLEKFHKIKGYFNADSYILYKSEVVEIKWENEACSIAWVDQYVYYRNKISYMPSERNMVILPDVRKVEFGNSNIRSFLFDWFDARKNYSKTNELSILNLANYYYDENSDEDHISKKQNGDSYDILLVNASSGLQSITPLVAMIDYLTNWIYKEDKISFEQLEKKSNVHGKLLKDAVYSMIDGKNVIGSSNLSYSEVLDNLFTTQNVQFIIEEPEQNLFPETQRDLVYHLLEKCLNKERNRLTITTHSPYVLYALNNCMLGGLVNKQLQGEEQTAFLSNEYFSKNAWIDPQLVSVWEIKDGTIRNIQDKDNIIAENYFDIKMTELTNEYYQILNYYQDEE